jgi:hypothetical protein
MWHDRLIEAVAAWRSVMHMENRVTERLTSFYTGHRGTGKFNLFLDTKFDQIFTELDADSDTNVSRGLFYVPTIPQSYAISRARRSGGLLELVISTQDLASSNPLDKVYGLLGMLPAEKAYLQPDYSRKTRSCTSI